MFPPKVKCKAKSRTDAIMEMVKAINIKQDNDVIVHCENKNKETDKPCSSKYSENLYSSNNEENSNPRSNSIVMDPDNICLLQNEDLFTQSEFENMPVDLFTQSEFDNMPVDLQNYHDSMPSTSATVAQHDEFIDFTSNNYDDVGNASQSLVQKPGEKIHIIEQTIILSNNNAFDNCSPQVDGNEINFEMQKNVSPLKYPSIKLVDYDSSSSEDAVVNNTCRKSLPLLLGKRIHSSDYSVTGDHNSDNDFILSNEEKSSDDEKFVGTGGLRKQRCMSRKMKRKCENVFGKGKSVQSNPCKKNCQHKCLTKINEVERHDIHEFYWGLGSYERQRNWLSSCMMEIPIKRRKQEASLSRRKKSFKYRINWNDKEIEICQQFLLETLNISQMTLRYLVRTAVQKSIKNDGRGKHSPYNKTKKVQIKMVHEFIMKLPAVPSHYCRNKTTRKYLSSELRNVSFLYQIFKKDQEMCHGRKNVVSLKVFRDIFKRDFNLGFHLPKKDKCKMCESRTDTGFQETEESKQIYEKHLMDKESCKALFLSDQKRANSKVLCASFDLQKVLNTPHGDNLLLYYSRKYSFYNETIYESGSQNAFCFLWGESEGNRGCSEICSILYKYLQDADERGFIEVLLYCDSCSGQNKNRATITMLHKFLQDTSRNIKKIKIVYLLPGHTYMPVDSVHATIERFIRRRIIWAPSEWETIITNARTKPRPFKAISMQHSDFFDWKKVGDYAVNPGKTKTIDGAQFKISEMRQAIFEKGNAQIAINYSYEEGDLHYLLLNKEATNIRKRTRRLPRTQEVRIQPTVERLYCETLPISVPKKKDLESLCNNNVIPTRYHEEYFKIKSKHTIKDVLPETDNEDDETNKED